MKQYWWVDPDTQKSIRGETLWPGEIDIGTDDDGNRFFVFKCDDENYPELYRIEYCDIKKYADKEHPDFSNFILREEPLVNNKKDFQISCEETLQELREFDGKANNALIYILLLVNPFKNSRSFVLFFFQPVPVSLRINGDEVSLALARSSLVVVVLSHSHIHLLCFSCNSTDARGDIIYNHANRIACKIMGIQQMTPGREKELAMAFLESQGRGVSWGKKKIDAPLFTCACCGFRNMDNISTNRTYREVDLSDINVQHVLRMRDDDDNDAINVDTDTNDEDDNDDNEVAAVGDRVRRRSHYVSLMEKEPLSIPYNNNGDMRKVDLWKLVSAWPAKKPAELSGDRANLPPWMFDEQSGNPNYYNLHPEFVNEKNPGHPIEGYTAMICSHCVKSINNGKCPWRSLAAGVDFGDPRRIGLEPLTKRERQIISKIRHYLMVIKIESNIDDQRTRERGQSALKGCGIFFDDDSPQVVTDLLSKESINNSISLQFVGPDGEYDTMIAKVLGSANVCGRAYVIYQWLAVLKEVNFHYEHDDELPEFSELCSRLKDANDALINDAEMIDDHNVVRETEIQKDDARKIRTSSSEYQELEVDSGDSEFPLRCSFFTSPVKGSNTDVDRDYLASAARALGVNEGEEPRYMSRRERDPINEFEHGDTMIAKAFPDVFLFGTAYNNAGPNLRKYEVEHLLMQYTTNAASCSPLLFQLFEQRWRHDVISGMHANVTSDPKGFEQFANEFVSEEFQTKLRDAKHNPSGPSAKYVMNKLVPVLTYAGRKSVFGALERNESAGQILALGRRFGCATSFLTFGIDDVNHPNAIRFALRSSNNRDFPAVVSNASRVEMERGLRLKGDEDEGYIPFHWNERFKTMIGNPVGAAIAYKQVVHDIMTILIGIKPSNYSGDNNRTTKTQFTSSSEPESIGINGTGWAFFGKSETTGSGSLHFHVVNWGGLAPELLESVADIPELCEKVASILNSTYCARVDRLDHVKDLTMKSMKKVEAFNRLRATRLGSKSAALPTLSPSGSGPPSDNDTPKGKSIYSVCVCVTIACLPSFCSQQVYFHSYILLSVSTINNNDDGLSSFEVAGKDV